MRLPHLAWRRWKLTPAEDAAVYIRIGIDTNPKEIVPDPIECGGMTPLPTRKSRRDEAFCTVPRARYASKGPWAPQHLGSSRGRGPAPSDRRAAATPRRLPAQARPRPHPRALRGWTARVGWAVRRPATGRPAPPLRPPPRDGGGAQELGSPQGPVDPSRDQAPGRPRGGPPPRVRRLRGRDSQGQLRRRRCHRLGPRKLPVGEARGSPRAAGARPRRDRLPGLQAPGPLDPRPHGRQVEGVAPDPEGGPAGPCGGSHRALSPVRPLGTHLGRDARRGGGARRPPRA